MDQKLVLVVDDEAGIREMMQLMLEDLFGVKTIGAEDGVVALKLARERNPALVLLDIMLPGLSGIEVARSLRQNSSTRNIPIIAVTASTSQDKVMAAGCDEFLQKPFDIDCFLGKVQKYVGDDVFVG